MAAAIASVVLVGAILLAYFDRPVFVPTQKPSSSSSSAYSSTAIQPFTSTSAVSSASFIAACSASLQHPYLGQNFAIPAGQRLDICVKFYYYSGSGNNQGPAILKPYGQIGIRNLNGTTADQGFTIAYSTASTTNANHNFTVQIGGPSSENEGYLVMYSISPAAAAGISNETYIMNFGGGLAPDVLGSKDGSSTTIIYGTPGPIPVEMCGEEFDITVGDMPSSHTIATHCFMVTETHASGVVAPARYPVDTIVVAIIGFVISQK
jgi:hypothetical protein